MIKSYLLNKRTFNGILVKLLDCLIQYAVMAVDELLDLIRENVVTEGS